MAGCSLNHWSQIEPPYAEYIAEKQPDKVRLTVAPEQARMELHTPRVTGDGVSGFIEGDSVWVALDRLQDVEVRKLSAAAVIIVSTLVATIIVVGVTAEPHEGGFRFPDWNGSISPP
jgi:hypothetical protein